jgi:mediator of RNA polymerase II transcription subunit 13, fungi type
MTHLAAVVPACTHLPLVHAALLSVEREMLWSFVAPQESTDNDCEWGGLRLLKEKDLSPAVFVDVSATTYLMLPTARIPLPSCSPTRELGSEFLYIPDLEIDVDPPDEYGVLPLSTAILLRVPASNSYDGISMLHIHLLHTIGGLGAEMDEGQRSQIQSDIAKNYHELCILAGMRAGRDHLPWHISAVAAMASALGSEEVSVD